jgi:regulator of ribonuclease activity A
MKNECASPIVTADIYDDYHEHLQVCELQFRSFGRIESFCGPCATVEVFEDHEPVLQALRTEGNGRILVVDGGGSLRVGIMGDKLAAIGVKSGWGGVIVVGAIRDSRSIDELDIGVKALGATARRGWSAGKARHGIPLQFGSVTVEPGCWAYVDCDCVIFTRDRGDVRRLPSNR